MCILSKYLSGSLQSQLDSVSFREAKSGLSSYQVTKHRRYLNINQKTLVLNIIFAIILNSKLNK